MLTSVLKILAQGMGKEILYSWFQTFAVIWILHIFFWVFPRRQIVVDRRFGNLYQFHLQSLWRWNWYRVPKRRSTTIWRRGNTQKKIYKFCTFQILYFHMYCVLKWQYWWVKQLSEWHFSPFFQGNLLSVY